MAKIAFILLCHKDPEAIIAQANRLTAVGDFVSIHFDAGSKYGDFQHIRSALKDNPNVTYAKKRVKCGWAEWSLVQATLNAIEAALDSFPKASHFYMVSGDCMSIKSYGYMRNFLDNSDVDYIESFDFFESDWIKTGMKEDRLHYRHFFNERTQKWLFYTSLNLQRRFGLSREVPNDIQVQIGSQWWCLRRRTVESIMEFIKRRRDVVNFFKTTWIPDETFFQTLVRHLIPDNQIRTRTLTFLVFSDYGMPATFYNDHYDFLIEQDYLFARKISPGAHELKARLGELYSSEQTDFNVSMQGKSLYQFLTQRGRVGQRYARRFWETEGSIGRDRMLYLVVCKKWHVAKRFVNQFGPHIDGPLLEYIFNETYENIPDLGGILSSEEKKSRHRRSLVRMLFEYYKTDRLLLCLDPGDFDILQDFCSDIALTRVLEIVCLMDDDYILGHAKRVNLISDTTPAEAISALLPSIRNELYHQSERIIDAGFDNFFRITEQGNLKKNSDQIKLFCELDEETATAIMEQDWLFAD